MGRNVASASCWRKGNPHEGTATGKRVIDRADVNLGKVKETDSGRVVEIGANRQSCDPSITLLFKLVLEVVAGHGVTAR